MPSSTKYSAVSAKIRVLYGRLLKQNDYEALAKKTQVSEVTAYLKEHSAYGTVLQNVNELQIHRRALEKMIRRVLFRDIESLSRFLDDGPKQYLYAFTMKYEIDFLKEIIRHLMNEKDSPFTPDLEYYAAVMRKLDIEALCRTKTYAQLLEQLSGTAYHRILSRFEENNLDLFQVETALDVYYMETMMRLSEQYLKGKDLEFVRESLGISTDLSNILAVIRSKTYFRATEQIVYAMIVTKFYKISKGALLELIRAKTDDQVAQLLSETKYKDVFAQKTGGFFDTNIFEYLYQFYRRSIRQSDHIGVVISYIYLKEMEIDNITAIIEGIRYHLPPEEMLLYLIGAY